MTEKKLKVPFLVSLLLATLIFLAILRPLRDLQTTTKKYFFILLKCPLGLNRDLRAEKRAETLKIHISPIRGRWDPIFGVVNPGPHTYKMTPSWRGFVILAPPRLVRLAK